MNHHGDRGRQTFRPQSSSQRAPRDGPAASGQASQEFKRVEQLWSGYLDGGYFDAKGKLRIEYVSRDKVEPLVRAMAQARPPLTHGQLRRFFQHCRRIETRLKTAQASWADVKPQVVFLDAAAEDSFGKSPPKIPALFRDFIQCNVAAVRSEEDLVRGFLPHFEALVGFSATHIQRERM